MTTDIEYQNLIQQAAHWMSRLAADDQPNWDDPELTAWLRQSPGHREAFAEISAIWFAADQLDADGLTQAPQAGAELERQPEIEALAGAGRRRRWPVLLAGLMTLLVALLLPAVPRQWAGMQADYVSQPGQMQSIKLDDGTTLKLAGDSAVSLATNSRGLTLHYGEIYLDVAHDPSAPFVVDTPRSRVTVLGTRFGVSWRNRVHRTGVEQGRVAVQHAGSQPIELTRGQFSRNGTMLDEPNSVQRYFGWSAGNLVFDQVPLSQVLERLAPFLKTPVVRVPGAGDPPVSAVVAVDGGEQVLETLAARAGLRLLSAGPVTLLY